MTNETKPETEYLVTYNDIDKDVRFVDACSDYSSAEKWTVKLAALPGFRDIRISRVIARVDYTPTIVEVGGAA